MVWRYDTDDGVGVLRDAINQRLNQSPTQWTSQSTGDKNKACTVDRRGEGKGALYVTADLSHERNVWIAGRWRANMADGMGKQHQ